MKVKFTDKDRDFIMSNLAAQLSAVLDELEKTDVKLGLPVHLQASFSFSFSSLLFSNK